MKTHQKSYLGMSWLRNSWYLRLAGATRAPWSAVVLPSLASAPHKDPRAPQNLVPIGGLERQLRHRLGDAALLYRSLRGALAA